MRKVLFVAWVCAVAATLQAWAVPAAHARVLAPHRAIYEITLDRSRGGAGVSDMAGRMVYELTGSECEGYTQSMRFITRMTNQEGVASLTDMRSSSTEDANAKSFRFSSSQYPGLQAFEVDNG